MIPPGTVLQSFIGHDVVLLMKDGRLIEGKLDGTDEHMNILLENSAEISEGKSADVGTLIIRGNNIVCVSLK